LLTRLGLFLLVVMAPFIAMFSRRAVAILVPVATALLILAAALDGRLPAAFGRVSRMAVSWPALAFLALLAWAAVTLLWTPDRADALARLTQFAMVTALFAGAIACMRQTSRRSDVNLIPIGVAIGAMTLVVEMLPDSPLAFLGSGRDSRIETQRAAMLIALLVWPAFASLIVQSRPVLAACLAVVTFSALWMVHDLVVLTAFFTGALAFALCSWRPRGGTLVIGGLTLAMLLLAPLVGWLMSRFGGFLLPREGDTLVQLWRDVTYALPTHLLQGFGFDASNALERGASGIILGSPRNAALQIWLELGLIGAALAAGALVVTMLAIEQVDEKARPAALAVTAAAATMMYAGPAAWQSWWATAVGLTAITLSFLSRRSARDRD
jgi:hypothetical protein